MAFNQLAPKELQELEGSFKALKIEPDHGNIEELEQAIKEEFLEGGGSVKAYVFIRG